MTDRTKTANYRRCCITDGNGSGTGATNRLDLLLAHAATAVKKPWRRFLGASGTNCQLLTTMMQKNGCQCGELVYYEDGRRIPLVDVAPDGSTWNGTIEPKDSQGKPRKFREQALYFAIKENHVAVIQSPMLRLTDLREFIAWMVQDEAKQIPGCLIDFENLPARAALEKLKDHHIRGVKIGERLFTSVREPAPPAADGRPQRKKYIQKLETSPRLLGILLGLGVSQPIIDDLKADPDPGSIHVDVEIRYRSRTEKEARRVLGALASTLGAQEGLDTEIQLDGKSKIRGDQLTIRGEVVVQCPGGCESMDDALSKLSRWLVEQIRTQTVI